MTEAAANHIRKIAVIVSMTALGIASMALGWPVVTAIAIAILVMAG